MLYLGQGKPGTTQDDMKVLQQKCGGENICVFKGSVLPGGNNTRHYIQWSQVIQNSET